MARETYPNGPANVVGFNRYMNESNQRVETELVGEQQYYIARLVNPEQTHIDRYAIDVLLRVIKVARLKSGEINIYAKRAGSDGSDDVAEDDSSPMNSQGFIFEDGKELGYLLDAFNRNPKQLGYLAAEAAMAA